MRIQFGNTWWGKKWLDALAGIDYSNRLPRGKTYARQGAVISVDISTGTIISKVQGRRKYSQKIKLPSFKKREKEKILKIITTNTIFLSKLLNKKLPKELFYSLNKEEIDIFPSSWDDLDASCDCPDWAVCCKHIASVIYIVANEIDKNPFLIFTMKGLDIIKELDRLGFAASDKNKNRLITLDQIYNNSKPEKETFSFDIKNLFELDFSNINDIQQNLLNLLEPNPLFYLEGNFKTILTKVYNTIKREANYFVMEENNDRIETFFKDSKQLEEVLELKRPIQDIQIVISTDFKKKKVHLKLENTKKIYRLSIIELLSFIRIIPLPHLQNHNSQIVFLYFLYHFVLRMLQQGAYIPQIFEVENDNYSIRWLPPLFDEGVKKIFDQFKNNLPTSFVSFEKREKKENKTIKKESIPDKEQQIQILLSLFLQEMITLHSKEVITRLRIHNEIIKLFFEDYVYRIKCFEEKEIPQTINQWLSKFFITHRDFAPIIKIDEDPDGRGFLLSILVENKKNKIGENITLNEIFSNDKHSSIRMQLLKDLSLLSEYFEPINIIIDTMGQKDVSIRIGDFKKVFFDIFPAIKLLGIKILLPKALRHIVYPNLVPSLKKKDNSQSIRSYMDLSDVLSFEWKIAIDDTMITPNEFFKLVEGASGIVKFKDKYLFIDEKKMQEMVKRLKKEAPLKPDEILKIGIEEQYDNSSLIIDEKVKKVFAELLRERNVDIPHLIRATLREYQQRGYKWLYKNSQTGFGSLIADDMGLGKTLQVICLLQKLKDEKKFAKRSALIVVPTTLLTNWQKEFEKFAPDLTVFVYHGQKRMLPDYRVDVIVTTYGVLRNEVELFNKVKWQVIVIDEAQNIKNHSTNQAKAVKKIKAPVKIAMTGTPVENRLTEYWSIFDFINRGFLGNIVSFKKDFAIPIEVYGDKDKLEKFRQITSPFILRRVKTDKSIISDLPDKLEFEKYCMLTKEQAAIYESVVQESINKIQAEDGINRKGLILQLITWLKQICNHPAQFKKDENIDSDLSGKTEMLLDVMLNILENNGKALIFTQYRQMGEILVKILKDKLDIDVEFLHGGVTRKKRDIMIENFQTKKSVKALILSLKAGGTGLNLTSATSVIHYDLWWNPAVESQATDRAYRIGQTENVFVYRFITKGTFEEKINAILNKKKELANLTVAQGEKWIGDFSDDELKELVSLS